MRGLEHGADAQNKCQINTLPCGLRHFPPAHISAGRSRAHAHAYKDTDTRHTLACRLYILWQPQHDESPPFLLSPLRLLLLFEKLFSLLRLPLPSLLLL